MLSPSKPRPRGRVARVDDGSVSRSTTTAVRLPHQTITISADGLRQTVTGAHSTKRRRINPEDLKDPYADWVPGQPDADMDEGEEIFLDRGDLDGEIGPMPEVTVNMAKRKRYLSSVSDYFSVPRHYTNHNNSSMKDNPMMVWRQYDHEFLQEMLRHEGLGSDVPSCCSCSADSPSRSSTPDPDSDGERQPAFIRCRDCCAGFVECTDCCVIRHQHLPFHRIEVRFIFL